MPSRELDPTPFTKGEERIESQQDLETTETQSQKPLLIKDKGGQTIFYQDNQAKLQAIERYKKAFNLHPRDVDENALGTYELQIEKYGHFLEEYYRFIDSYPHALEPIFICPGEILSEVTELQLENTDTGEIVYRMADLDIISLLQEMIRLSLDPLDIEHFNSFCDIEPIRLQAEKLYKTSDRNQ